MIAELVGDQFERKQERSGSPPTCSVVLDRVVFEPRSSEVRKAVFGAREKAAQQSQDSAVRHHEDAPARVEPDDVVEGGHRAGLRRLGGFETRWTTIGLEPARPLLLDFLASQPLPFAGIVLAPACVDPTGRAPDDFGEQVGGDRRSFEIARDHEIERWTLRCEETARLTSLQSTESRERGIGLALPLAESIPFALTVSHDEDPRDDSRSGAGHERLRYPRYARHVVTLRLFAQARDVAGTSRDTLPGATIDEVVAAACVKYGDRFVALLPSCRIWLNGEEVPPSTPVSDKDEVAVLPPVSGGCE